ncbi:MAG: filamentous hemagglutinin N-terminal domain-containing protein, partial [Azoarcus sp.]|nr:filamentous hemagglutinin N-terminal domain-containing protein [Azoarcus sp.]
MIANPSGLNVNGASFINASRTTLVTGRADLLNGSLAGFTVEDGTIRVEGGGLDARQSDYTALLARAVELNGKVHAQALTVVTGQNRISPDAKAVTPRGERRSCAPLFPPQRTMSCLSETIVFPLLRPMSKVVCQMTDHGVPISSVALPMSLHVF